MCYSTKHTVSHFNCTFIRTQLHIFFSLPTIIKTKTCKNINSKFDSHRATFTNVNV